MKTINIKQPPVFLLAFMCLTFLAATSAAAPQLNPVACRNDMRRLWMDHITWTRLYLVAEMADSPIREATADRLIQNQTDLGNAMKPFYGKEAGDKLAALLKEHVFATIEFIKAVKAQDWESQDDATNRWNDNADEIAAWFSNANPRWALAEMKSMWHAHVNFTIHEVTAHMKQHWQEDIAAFDKVQEQILTMADLLSDGIIQQFPDRFKIGPSIGGDSET